ncbi:histidine phosphatase family protein, partial [Pseudomonas aeruginosa]|nr:histidine phosphatase family protein [Pseudomonas aeruginosa]
LADEGVAELKKLVKEAIYPQADEGDFYTTGLKRTEQTLALIYGDREHEVIPELKEMGFGDFEMKSYEDLKEVPEYVGWISA